MAQPTKAREHDRRAVTQTPYYDDWLGNRSDHPWADDPRDEGVALHIEPIFDVVTRANPEGLARKRREFRTITLDWQARAAFVELALAHRLLSRGMNVSLPTRPDLVINGQLGIEITTRHTESKGSLGADLDDLESWIQQVTQKKAHQSIDCPTILAIDTGSAGNAWIRPSQAWRGALPTLLKRTDHFMGIMTVQVSYESPWLLQAALAVRESADVPEVWGPFLDAMDLAP